MARVTVALGLIIKGEPTQIWVIGVSQREPSSEYKISG